jgi:hypothetical protein
MKKVIIFGLLAGLIMLALSMILGSVFHIIAPDLKSEYENANLFRPWSDPLMLLMFVQPFLVGIILAWIWQKTKGLFTGTELWKSGLCFGFIYWVTTIPGMVISYSTFQISLLMVANWTASNLLAGLCAGILFSKTIK